MTRGQKNFSESSRAPRLGKKELMEIAASTLKAIENGSYEVDGTVFRLADTVKYANEHTILYTADSDLAAWETPTQKDETEPPLDAQEPAGSVHMSIVECSVLVGARTLKEELERVSDVDKRVGVLNFASAKHPGGGFLTGAQAQEESIARSSTIYPSLMTDTAQRFYQGHKRDPKKGYYSHAMIYSPRTLLVRSDSGDWLPPVEMDMLTSCAVNAGVVRRYLREADSTDESSLDEAMRERMARVLYLFEQRGVRNLVLGSFGTGVFRNRVELVAGVWKELLEGRFKHSFDRVVFAILGTQTVQTFREVFSTSSQVHMPT